MYDVMIIGKGPAGLSAALYAVRANLKTLIVSNGMGSLEKADKVDNYFGFSKTISGRELLSQSIEKARKLGVTLIEDEIMAVNGYDTIEMTGQKEKYQGKTLIIATGKSRKKVHIKGMNIYEGKGISYCATCDGFFYKDKKVALLGYNDYMAHELQDLLQFTKDITIFTHGKKITTEKALDEINIEEGKIQEILGKDDHFTGIKMENDQEKTFDGLFVAYESPGGSDLATKVGLMLEKGNIVVDKQQKTNIPNIFAAGDCTGGFLQIAVAVGEGAIAAKSAIDFIRES